MSFSAAEITSLGVRAARGAGAPPQQAGVFGRVLLRHLLAGRDLAEVTEALDALPAGPIVALPLALLAEKMPSETDLERSYVEAQAPAVAGRVTPPAWLLAQLEQLAARVLVPESNASRLDGAGAGLTDND